MHTEVETTATVNTDQVQANADAVQTEDTGVDTAHAVEKSAVSVESYNRVLEESRKYKARAQAAEKAKAEEERQRLEEQAQYKKLYESEREKFEGLSSALRTASMKHAIKDAAAKSGCVDYKALFKLGNQDLLQYDEATNEVSGIESFIANAKDKYAFLFQKQTSTAINPVTPGGQVVTDNKPLSASDIAKLPEREKLALMTKLTREQKR